MQPIHQDDVSRRIRAALEIAWDDPHSLVIAGPGPLPYFAFVQQVARAAGLRPPRWIALPAWSRGGRRLSQFVPLLPTVRPAEIRRLLEDKAFDIAPMRAALNVQPIALPEGLARTFAPTGRRRPHLCTRG